MSGLGILYSSALAASLMRLSAVGGYIHPHTFVQVITPQEGLCLRSPQR
jgi:hypothetical protein